MAQPQPRLTTSMSDAAKQLGYKSTSRIRQLLNDKDEPLDGPESPGRGRGRCRLVYTDTIAAQSQKRARKRPHANVASLAVAVERLEWQVDELTGSSELDEVKQRLRQVEQENRQLRYAKAKSEAAADALRDALKEQAEAARLRRKAERHDAAAMAALRRAEKARDDAS